MNDDDKPDQHPTEDLTRTERLVGGPATQPSKIPLRIRTLPALGNSSVSVVAGGPRPWSPGAALRGRSGDILPSRGPV